MGPGRGRGGGRGAEGKEELGLYKDWNRVKDRVYDRGGQGLWTPMDRAHDRG